MKSRHVAEAAAGAGRKTRKSADEEQSISQDESPDIFDWGSSVVLIALIRNSTLEGSACQSGRILFITPCTRAFDELAKQGPFISELWLMAANAPDQSVSYLDRIDEVSSWSRKTPAGRPLLVLRGKGGQLTGIDDDGAFTLRSSSVHWSGGGYYEGAPSPADPRTASTTEGHLR